LLTGKALFPGNDLSSILSLNRQCDLSLAKKHLEKLSIDALSLLYSLIEKDPKCRATAREALSSKFFKTHKDAIEECLKMNAQYSKIITMHSVIRDKEEENLSLGFLTPTIHVNKTEFKFLSVPAVVN
jgi:serine/threonine protein kinase